MHVRYVYAKQIFDVDIRNVQYVYAKYHCDVDIRYVIDARRPSVRVHKSLILWYQETTKYTEKEQREEKKSIRTSIWI